MQLYHSSRRRFCKHIATTSMLAWVSNRGRASAEPIQASDTPEIQVDSVTTISPTPDIYCGWPTMTRRRNGQLLLVWSGGREQHVCPFGRVDMMTSDDQGATWTWPRTLIDGAIDDRDAGVIETATGALLVTTFTSLAYQSQLDQQIAFAGQPGEPPGRWPEEKLKRWRAAHNRIPAAERDAELGQWMIRSSDGGVTWSERYPTIVNSPHGPTQLADGRLIYAGKQLWTKDRAVGVCQSVDDGVSWQWLAAVPTRPGDDLANYHELHAVEAASGRLILHLRNHNPAHDRETLQSESTDGGKTWTIPHPIGVWGLPSFLSRLADGRLLMTYSHRRAPLGIQARISADEGDTWGAPLVIWGAGTSGDLGYPSTVEFESGEMLTVWYERLATSERAVLRQARWRFHS